MDDNLQDRTIGPKREKEQIRIDSMVIPCLVILVIMLTLLAVQQHIVIGQYKESVLILQDSKQSLKDRHDELWENVEFAVETLAEVDLDYIETIPTGAELRIRLALDALTGGE